MCAGALRVKSAKTNGISRSSASSCALGTRELVIDLHDFVNKVYDVVFDPIRRRVRSSRARIRSITTSYSSFTRSYSLGTKSYSIRYEVVFDRDDLVFVRHDDGFVRDQVVFVGHDGRGAEEREHVGTGPGARGEGARACG